MKLGWGCYHDGIGNGLGYTTHERKLMSALEKNGVEFTKDADTIMYLIPPYFLDNIIRFKNNVLYTMFEFDRLPDYWSGYLNKTDLVIVPCEHNRKIFQKQTFRPVEVVPEGVDINIYQYHRRVKVDPFVFLYVGDNNTRKGTYHIAKAWELFNEKYPVLKDKIQLIMKMTKPGEKQELKQITYNSYIDYRLLPLNISDSKKYELPMLQDLYYYAHCFLFPSMGEGFGLTLAEAMATGLPCIYTPWSGPVDFINRDEGYPVEFLMKDFIIKNDSCESVGVAAAADPDIESIVEQMHMVYSNYDEAIKKAEKARKHIEQFTWEKSAENLICILEKHGMVKR